MVAHGKARPADPFNIRGGFPVEAVRITGWGWAGGVLGFCAPHQDFCAQLCQGGDNFITTCAMHPPQGKKCECQVTQEARLPSCSSAQARPQVLSTGTVVTQPHKAAPVSHLQCYSLSLSPCVKLSGTAGLGQGSSTSPCPPSSLVGRHCPIFHEPYAHSAGLGLVLNSNSVTLSVLSHRHCFPHPAHSVVP